MNSYDIGQRIKAVRKSQHLTQEKLAELIDVSPHYIYEIEKGLKKMSLETFISITAALNISADYILFGSVSNTDSNSNQSSDHLDILVRSLNQKQRKAVTNILCTLIPFLK